MTVGCWRKDLGGNGLIHLVVNKRARCSYGGFPKGRVVIPPKTGEEPFYCYNCHYHSIFDTMPKAKVKVLSLLLNREIMKKTNTNTAEYLTTMEAREKDLSTRLDNVRKSEDELQKLRTSAKENEKFTKIGQAFSVLSTALGGSIMESSMDAYKKYYSERW